MELQNQNQPYGMQIAATPMIATIKSIISSILLQRGIAFKEIILFGSRARGNFDKYSDYDILVIVKEQVDTRKKIDIIESIRTELAKLLISSDIILKSQQEANYYKEKIGSVVREAFKEGGASVIDTYLKNWLIKALEDVTLVEHELRLPGDEVITSAVCFHAQQAVEKLLKAFLIFKNVDFGRTHDLKLLLNLCRNADDDFNDIDVGNLTFYAVEVRYPDDFYIPSIEEARESAKIASDVMHFVYKKLDVDINRIK